MSHKKQGEIKQMTQIKPEDKKDFKGSAIEGTKGVADVKEEVETEEEKKKKLDDEIAKIVADGPMSVEKVLAIEKIKAPAMPPVTEKPEESKPISGETVIKNLRAEGKKI